ncbi:HAD domain-containing protein [Paraburkholderia hospita]|uniref:HAD domain-containing protein n=1 Tax=Paraburkholderia hospita TaxID=169430 RepID=UPI0009CB8582|nr:HAD domain-containing protein [Paraburkholderia hospita]SKC68908.1 hypothetical protein SAMN05446934_1821 [Paraburkholderia hospita]
MAAIGFCTSGVLQKRTPSRPRMLASVPLLYLDYDNCLHACDAYKAGDLIVPSVRTETFFAFADVLECLLAPYPALQIVLSTSWVEAIGFEAARDSLPFSSLRARVVGATFNPKENFARAWREIPRGQQVRRHVTRYGIEKWLALDDMREGFEGVEGHLVHCQPGVGLGDKDVQKLFADRLATMFGTPGLVLESGMPGAPADGDR